MSVHCSTLSSLHCCLPLFFPYLLLNPLPMMLFRFIVVLVFPFFLAPFHHFTLFSIETSKAICYKKYSQTITCIRSQQQICLSFCYNPTNNNKRLLSDLSSVTKYDDTHTHTHTHTISFSQITTNSAETSYIIFHYILCTLKLFLSAHFYK